MRIMGHIPAVDYRKVIVGLIFLRYISAAFEKRYAQLVAEGDGFEDDLIEGIVALPPQLFYSVTIPVTLWFISKNKQQNGTPLFNDVPFLP